MSDRVTFPFVRHDVRRFLDEQHGILETLGAVLFSPGLHAVLLYRLSRWFYLHRLRFLSLLVSYISSIVTGAQISPRAAIGGGLLIYHPHGIVIGATTVIGRDCTLVHGNVIGQLQGGGDRPVIGDQFFAGTGAKILGRIHIGNRVRVGANAVVATSVPDETTIAMARSRAVFDLSDRKSTDEGQGRAPMWNRGEILQRVLPLLKTATSLDATEPIDETTGLLGEGLGFDSIEVLSLVSAIEEEFDVTIDDADLKVSHFATIGRLVTFIEERLSS